MPVVQLVKKFDIIFLTLGLLPCSQGTTTKPYPKLGKSSILPHYISSRFTLKSFSHLYQDLPSVPPSGLPTNILLLFLFPLVCDTCPDHIMFLEFIIHPNPGPFLLVCSNILWKRYTITWAKLSVCMYVCMYNHYFSLFSCIRNITITYKNAVITMDLTKFYQQQIYTFIISVSVKTSLVQRLITEQIKIIVFWNVINTSISLEPAEDGGSTCPSKCWNLSTKLHAITSNKTVIFIVTITKASNLTNV
jgi:hypothetical protein